MHNIPFTPFSDNIIFLDTEFSSTDPYIGEVVSIGMVTLDGKEFYIELEYKGEYSEWMKENLLHTLKGPKVSREEAVKKISHFVGKDRPYIVGYASHLDNIYLLKLFSSKEAFVMGPFHWLPIDFASILFAFGIDPESYLKNEMKFIRELGIDITKYRLHDALDDAKLLREVYLKFVTKKS